MTTYNIYRRESIDEPKALIASDVVLKNYVDDTAESGKTYLYSVGAAKNNIEKISNEVRVITLLFIARLLIDSLTASVQTNILDSSVDLRSISSSGPAYDYNLEMGSKWGALVWESARHQVTIPQLTTQDFLIDCEYTPIAGGANNGRILSLGSAQGALLLNKSSSSLISTLNVMVFTDTWYVAITSTDTLNNGINRIRILRKNGVFYLYLNGVLQGIANTFSSFSITQTAFCWNGWNAGGVDYVHGVFGSVKISANIPTTTENYTPRIGEYIAEQGDILVLVAGQDRFKDISQYNRVVSVFGTPYFIRKTNGGSIAYKGGRSIVAIPKIGRKAFQIKIEGLTISTQRMSSIPRLLAIGNQGEENSYVMGYAKQADGALFLTHHYYRNGAFRDFIIATNIEVGKIFDFELLRENDVFTTKINGVVVNALTDLFALDLQAGNLYIGAGYYPGESGDFMFDQMSLEIEA